MSRLTTDKKTSEMNMTELALNSCYVKNGEAWYRDYDTDISTRNLVREIYKNIDIKMPEDDREFDETLFEDLEYGLNTDIGLLALLYRNMWAMAELREKLKKYEDAEEQGLLLRLPVKVGDTIYHIGSKPFGDGLVLSIEEGTICGFEFETEWVIWVKANNDYRREAFDFDDIGKTVFLTREEAEQKLKEMEE